MSDSFKGFLYSVVGTFSLSVGLVAAKYVLEALDPLLLSFIWSLSASIWAAILVLILEGKGAFKIPRTSYVSVFVLGISTGAGIIFTWSGLNYLDPSFAAFLWRFMPILMILAGVLVFGEKLYSEEIPPILVVVLGGFISTVGRWQIVGKGVVFTILACIAGAVQMVIGKMESRVSAIVLSFYRASLGAVVIGLWLLLTTVIDSSSKIDIGLDIPLRYLLVIFSGSFVGATLGFYFIYTSYRYWDIARTSIVIVAQPLMVMLLAEIFLDQFPSLQELLGGIIILIGSFWLGLLGLRRWQRKDRAL